MGQSKGVGDQAVLQQKSQVHIIHGQIIGLSDFNPRVKGFNQVLKLGFTEQSYFLQTFK